MNTTKTIKATPSKEPKRRTYPGHAVVLDFEKLAESMTVEVFDGGVALIGDAQFGPEAYDHLRDFCEIMDLEDRDLEELLSRAAKLSLFAKLRNDL